MPSEGVPEALRKLVRKSWKPIVADGQGPDQGSRFGGCPWLPTGEVWPDCPSCGQSMNFFAQLRCDQLPDGALGQGEGLIQVFYCTNGDKYCDDALEGWGAWSEVGVHRRVGTGPGNLGEPHGIEPFPAKQVVSWKPKDDYPNLEDTDVELTEEEEEAWYESDHNAAGDKLGGWPAWVQGPEYPDCRKCHRQMELVLQIDSEDNVPHMWGDVGCAHVTACPDHPDEMTLAWACG